MYNLLRLRAGTGQLGCLYMTAESAIHAVLETRFGIVPPQPYTLTDFHTLTSACASAPLNHHVDLLLRVVDVSARLSKLGESYLSIVGWDSDGVRMGPLHLWRFKGGLSNLSVVLLALGALQISLVNRFLYILSDGDVVSQRIYIIRGLQIVPDMYFDAESGQKWLKFEGARKLEASNRTAVEDVSDVLAFVAHFGA